MKQLPFIPFYCRFGSWTNMDNRASKDCAKHYILVEITFGIHDNLCILQKCTVRMLVRSIFVQWQNFSLFYAYWGRYPRKPVFGRKFPWGLLCPYVFFIIRFFCSSIFLSLTSYMFLVFTRVAFYISLTCFQVCDVFDFKSDELAGTMGTGSCDWTRKGPRD